MSIRSCEHCNLKFEPVEETVCDVCAQEYGATNDYAALELLRECRKKLTIEQGTRYSDVEVIVTELLEKLDKFLEQK